MGTTASKQPVVKLTVLGDHTARHTFTRHVRRRPTQYGASDHVVSIPHIGHVVYDYHYDVADVGGVAVRHMMVGGSRTNAAIRRELMRDSDAVVFVVDSTTPELRASAAPALGYRALVALDAWLQFGQPPVNATASAEAAAQAATYKQQQVTLYEAHVCERTFHTLLHDVRATLPPRTPVLVLCTRQGHADAATVDEVARRLSTTVSRVDAADDTPDAAAVVAADTDGVDVVTVPNVRFFGVRDQNDDDSDNDGGDSGLAAAFHWLDGGGGGDGVDGCGGLLNGKRCGLMD